MKNQQYILALDQGTTSSRAIVFDRSSRIVATAQKEFRQIYPRPGWVEHDPYEIWSSQIATAAEVLAKADLTAANVAAVGITNQRETTIVWERDSGRPIYNAIVWQDRRTADFCSQLKRDGAAKTIREKTGLVVDPYFSASKVRWILENVAGARKQAEAGRLMFGTVDSWLLYNLTGRKVHATDVSNASRTQLLNIHAGEWDNELLALFDIPRSMLPEVRSCSEIYGHVAADHYPAGVAIAGMAGDQQAALFGQACFTPGMAKNTYGTGCFLLMNTGTEAVVSQNNLLTTIAWRANGTTEYALEGSVFIGGAVVQWLRDEMKLVESVQELDRLAATVPDSGGLYLVPAFAGLGAPHWDAYARGAALGITRGTNRAHFCRAALEAIAFQSADLIACMESDSGLRLKELRVDGGAARSEPLMQFQADLLGTSVVRPRDIETTALGAAYHAGLAVGYWTGRDDVVGHWAAEKTYTPNRPQDEMARLRQGWERALERAKKWESEDCGM